MNLGRTVFSQLLNFLPTYQFQICVDRYQGNRYVKEFSCWDQFLRLAFAQLTYRESLAISRPVCAPSNPSFIIWASVAKFLAIPWHTPTSIATGASMPICSDPDCHRPRSVSRRTFRTRVVRDRVCLRSTTIDLCLALFPWGKFRRHKSAVKLHTLLDLRGSIPTNVYVTGGQVNDVNLLDELLLEAGSFYLLDRGYVDFARLYIFTQACAFFITRARKDCSSTVAIRALSNAQGCAATKSFG